MSQSSAAVPRDVSSLSDVLAVLVRRRRTVVLLPLLLGVLTVGWTLLRPRVYSATVVFMPERSDLGRLGGLAGVASQFGVNLPLGETGLSPLFYSELLRSRELLGDLATSSLPAADGATQPLMDHLKVQAANPPLRREKATDRLRRLIAVTPDEAVGLVRVRVVMHSPELAKAVADRLVALIDQFNGERRRTRARAEREFAETQERDALAELRAAEGRLLAFVTQNRQVGGSPELMVQRDRLSREVTVRQSLYTSLRQALEQSRLEEVRDTPTITLVEHAQLPARPDSRKLIQKLALAGAIGLLLGAFAALWAEHRSVRLATRDLREEGASA
jgi:uncharacterized protein involved in exopolysaccharide biosynthesis